MKKKILVVEDSLEFRTILKSILEIEGFSVTLAADGLEAMQLAENKKFDLILSDIQMPKMDGIALFHTLRTTLKEKTPFIAMTGFADISSTGQAYDYGMDGFIPKPFVKADIIESVNMILNPCTLDQDKNLDSKFYKISIESFISGFELPFKVYIRISAYKYLKIAHSGEDLDLRKIQEFKNRNLKNLYVERNDFKSFLGFTVSLSKGVEHSRKISKDKKQKFVYQIGETILGKCFVDGLQPEEFRFAQEFVEIAASLALESDTNFEIFESLLSSLNSVYVHSLAVSIYSVLIVKHMPISSSSLIIKAALAGLFHDIGKRELDINLPKNINDQRTPKEQKKFESHVTRGGEILNSFPSFPADVREAVLSHHEHFNGTGYPNKLKGDQICILGKVLFIASEFCSHVFSDGIKPDPIAALAKMHENVQWFDPQLLGTLSNLFNYVV